MKLLVLLALLVLAHAWGPFTHQILGCAPDRQTCGKNPISRSFILGSSAPDALKFINPYYHSFDFADKLFNLARTSSSPSRDFDYLAFAQGYGAHLSEDYAGHHRNSILFPKYNHELEFAVDTLLWQRDAGMKFPTQYFDEQPESMRWLSEVVLQQILPPRNHTAPSPHEVREGLHDFDGLVRTEKAAIVLNVFAKGELVEFNAGNCHCAKYEGCIEPKVNANLDWSLDAASTWVRHKGEHPEKPCDAEVRRFVDAQFERYGGSICGVKQWHNTF
eukprot:gnl/Trimastix_PCT/1516.p1 GENE.gnl/Trimastix_PCT/1516~~gnl/Trimastix_PCT/1516.p1  ORF type:complete len:287 (+),score=67.60 gnl/Trimastix_PCT/1516:39-863(+)